MDWGVALGVIAIVIAVVALVIAAPPFAQMIWGKPELTIEFEAYFRESAHELKCNIINQPIKGAFLKNLGVSRSATEISADYSVYKSGTNECVDYLQRAIISTDQNSGLLVNVTAHFVPARFKIIVHSPDNGAKLIKMDGTLSEPLLRGKYYIDVGVVASNGDVYRRQHDVLVGSKPEDTFWLGQPRVI